MSQRIIDVEEEYSRLKVFLWCLYTFFQERPFLSGVISVAMLYVGLAMFMKTAYPLSLWWMLLAMNGFINLVGSLRTAILHALGLTSL